ncbi:MAG: PASTA domain-containing protein [Lawsonibacter sp.]|nr:PASTA domain-containing protein [Lawsonibacter sp.]MCI9654704.1 PASTA domain-containing protein [Lawsonibacter sp.]
MVLCGMVIFIPLGWKLWDIAIVNCEAYQKAAQNQHGLDFVIPAERGKIYDRNSNVMAMSTTVYTLILSPRDLVKSVSNKDEEGNTLSDEVYQAKVAARQDQMVEELMNLIPDLDRQEVEGHVHATKMAYREIKVNIEEEEHKRIQEYIVENKASSYLYQIAGSKRYYPYSGLAAQALGFVNANGGAYGIEAVYNDVLEGTAGRVVTTRTAAGTERYNSYAEYIDAVNGYNITLTIDTTIQSYLEKTLEEGIKDFEVQDGAFAIAMNPKTGAIYGIASSPDFDPNNYGRITNELLSSQLDESAAAIFEKLKASNTENLTDSQLMEKAESQAYSDAVNTQWRNKAIDSRYEPGSVFKAIVLAAALEEGVVSENDHFFCSGEAVVPGYPKPIKCSNTRGHKDQNLAKAVANSCNPAFIEIGKRLGVDTFYDYFEAFGMLENTGIDLPGEASLAGAVWSRDKMSNVDLAVASFGQRFEITPLQMICGFSAVINGGNLVKPYVVQSVSTQDGTVVQNTQPEVVRQVISKQTSQRAADILEQVVATGSGNNGYVAGYRIGGKTGTSEVKTVDLDHYVVSFMGYAPADDPQVIVLLAYDHPKVKEPGSNYGPSGVYISGGNMAAKKAGPLIAQILDYLGIEKTYSTEEAAAADVVMPKVTGLSVTKAEDDLSRVNLRFRTIGEGETVSRQIPAAGTRIPGGSTVILYLGDSAPEASGTVPDVRGMTYENAKNALEKAGFFMRASGASVYYGNTTTAESQSIAGGVAAVTGTVVDVKFFNQVEDGYAG